MSFESSSIQWALPVLAVVLTLIFALDFARRRRVLERVGEVEMIALMANSLSTKRRVFRAFLYILAMVLCGAALAKPTSQGEVAWRQRGIDVAFVYDFSTPMLAKDVYPSRLARSLKESETLMTELKADRVATVVFAGGAAHFPLTHDHVAARLLYQGLRPSHLAPGSDLGQAIRVASCVLRSDAASPELCDIFGNGRGGAPLRGQAEPMNAEAPLVSERARAMLIFTSGQDSEGFAEQEIEIARSLGIEVFIIGVGTLAGELVPLLDKDGHEVGWAKERDGSFQTTQVRADFLRALADKAEGPYFSLGEGRWRGDLLLESLDALKRGDLDQRVIQSRNSIFERFLFPCFLLLLLEACLSERRRRTPLPVPGGRNAQV